MTYSDLRRAFPIYVDFIPIDRFTRSQITVKDRRDRRKLLERNVYLCEIVDAKTVKAFLY